MKIELEALLQSNCKIEITPFGKGEVDVRIIDQNTRSHFHREYKIDKFIDGFERIVFEAGKDFKQAAEDKGSQE